MGYVHDWVDKLGWSKQKGDKLVDDPLAEERRLFWERLGLRASARELSELEFLRAWLLLVPDEKERRALLAWARAKAGGKSFKRWCMKVEGIHPETGRRRKDRAISRISANLVRGPSQNSETAAPDLLPGGPEIDHLSDTIAEAAGKRDEPNAWMADDAFQPFVPVYKKSYGKEVAVPARSFSWAAKRNERRRKREAEKRKKAPVD